MTLPQHHRHIVLQKLAKSHTDCIRMHASTLWFLRTSALAVSSCPSCLMHQNTNTALPAAGLLPPAPAPSLPGLWCFKPQTSFVCRSFRLFSWSRVRLFCSSFATYACRQEDRWQLVLWRGLSLVAAEAKSCLWKVLCLLPSFPCISSPAQSFLSVCLSALAQQHCNYKLNQSYENFSPGALAIISGTRSRYGCCCSTSGHKDGCCSWRSISYGSACDCLHSASGGWSTIL